MTEATMQSITLQEMAPATFRIMLRFMYTDVLPGEDELGGSPLEIFQDLLAAADRYALDRLKLMCAQKLLENVTVDTVATMLACAETYNCPELKNKCLDFFAVDKHFKKAVFTDGFRGRVTGLEARTTVVHSAGSVDFVVDYEQTKDLAIGNAVYSDPISVGGCDWWIKCYPRGNREADRGEYLSVYVGLRRKSATVRAIFKASVLGKHGKPVFWSARSRLLDLTSKDNYWGWSRFVRRADLEPKYVTEGRVTFLCHILVMCDKPIPLPPPRNGNHLSKLLDEMDGTDVSFTTNGQTFHAHRAVLAARSPVFKAKFFGSGAEATSSNISLDDIDPATFKVLLNFIYTDTLPGDDGLGCSPSIQMFHRLFAAADKYALHRLKLICAQKLWENVSLDSVATTLEFAEMHSCLELKSKCIEFLVAGKHFNGLLLTEGFVQLGQKFPSLIAELKQRVEA
ncbi:unnamed protein product [Alopecurus aequalis]